MKNFTIALEGMEFYAHHGVFTEENKLGNRYEVSVYLQTVVNEAEISDDLKRTVDYGLVYKKVKDEMQIPRKLLETIASNICGAILASFEQVASVKTKVVKHNPPLNGLCARAFVEHELVR